MIYAAIYVDGKFVGDAGVTQSLELHAGHAKELAWQVNKVLGDWIKDRPATGSLDEPPTAK